METQILTTLAEPYLTQLRDLWMEAFGDSSEYVSFVLNHLPKDTLIFTMQEKEMILGAVYLFACRLEPSGIPAYYGYAGAVRKSCQGYQIYPQLMRSAIQYCQGHGACSLGYASHPGLRKPYARLGESTFYQACEYTFADDTPIPDRLGSDDIIFSAGAHTDNKGAQLSEKVFLRRPLTPECWKNQALSRIPTGQSRLFPSDAWLQYLKEEKLFCGNLWEEICLEGTWYAFIGDYISPNTDEKDAGPWLQIEETTAPVSLLKSHIPAICRYYQVKGLHIRYPVGTGVFLSPQSRENAPIPFKTNTGTYLNAPESGPVIVYNGQGDYADDTLWCSFRMK